MQYISVQKAVMWKRIGIDICIDRLYKPGNKLHLSICHSFPPYPSPCMPTAVLPILDPSQLGGCDFQGTVIGLDDLLAALIVPGDGNQVHHLGHHLHIGHLQVA